MRNKLSSLISKAIKNLASLTSTAIDFALVLFVLCGLVIGAAKAPELHSRMVRSYVGSKVYLVTNDEHRGSGTGFAVEAASGITYVMTNDHVCEVASPDGYVVLVDREGNELRRRVIERSNFSDLCLVEGWPGVEGLEVGSEPSIGQIIAAVGHPNGYDITLTRGEIIQRDDVIIPEGPISILNPNTQKEEIIEDGIAEDQCRKPKNRIMWANVPFFFFVLKMKYCVNVTEAAYFTNMMIQPGSSGSPIVDFWGNVVGVVFAGDRAMWGIAVSHDDLVKMLKNY